MEAPLPEALQEHLGQVAPPSSVQWWASSGLPAIPAAIGDPEGHRLAFVVDGSMELETKEPAHGATTTLGRTWEDPVTAGGRYGRWPAWCCRHHRCRLSGHRKNAAAGKIVGEFCKAAWVLVPEAIKPEILQSLWAEMGNSTRMKSFSPREGLPPLMCWRVEGIRW